MVEEEGDCIQEFLEIQDPSLYAKEAEAPEEPAELIQELTNLPSKVDRNTKPKDNMTLFLSSGAHRSSMHVKVASTRSRDREL